MKKPEDRVSDYVCSSCGIQYLTEQQKQNSYATTFHEGICGLCEQNKSITHMRHFNYLREKQN